MFLDSGFLQTPYQYHRIEPVNLILMISYKKKEGSGQTLLKGSYT